MSNYTHAALKNNAFELSRQNDSSSLESLNLLQEYMNGYEAFRRGEDYDDKKSMQWVLGYNKARQEKAENYYQGHEDCTRGIPHASYNEDYTEGYSDAYHLTEMMSHRPVEEETVYAWEYSA